MHLNDREAFPIVWIYDEEVYGIIIHMGAYVSTVQYNQAGIRYEVLMENDDFHILDEISIGYEEE